MSGKDEKETYICECLKITEGEMRQAIRENNLKTLDDVSAYYKTSWACGDCFKKIEETLGRR